MKFILLLWVLIVAFFFDANAMFYQQFSRDKSHSSSCIEYQVDLAKSLIDSNFKNTIASYKLRPESIEIYNQLNRVANMLSDSALNLDDFFAKLIPHLKRTGNFEHDIVRFDKVIRKHNAEVNWHNNVFMPFAEEVRHRYKKYKAVGWVPIVDYVLATRGLELAKERREKKLVEDTLISTANYLSNKSIIVDSIANIMINTLIRNDSIMSELLRSDMYYENNGLVPGEPVKGSSINQNMDLKSENPPDEILNTVRNIEYNNKCLSDLNRASVKLNNIYENQNRTIGEFNSSLAKYNAQIDQFNMVGDTLLNRIKCNNKKIKFLDQRISEFKNTKILPQPILATQMYYLFKDIIQHKIIALELYLKSQAYENLKKILYPEEIKIEQKRNQLVEINNEIDILDSNIMDNKADVLKTR